MQDIINVNSKKTENMKQTDFEFEIQKLKEKRRIEKSQLTSRMVANKEKKEIYKEQIREMKAKLYQLDDESRKIHQADMESHRVYEQGRMMIKERMNAMPMPDREVSSSVCYRLKIAAESAIRKAMSGGIDVRVDYHFDDEGKAIFSVEVMRQERQTENI